MTDNQFDQLFNMVTKCVGGIQELQRDVGGLKTDVSELKTDVAELKTGQAEIRSDVAELKTDVAELKQGQIRLEAGQTRLEKEMQLTNKSFLYFQSDLMNLRAKVGVMEDEMEGKKQLSN